LRRWTRDSTLAKVPENCMRYAGPAKEELRGSKGCGSRRGDGPEKLARRRRTSEPKVRARPAALARPKRSPRPCCITKEQRQRRSYAMLMYSNREANILFTGSKSRSPSALHCIALHHEPRCGSRARTGSSYRGPRGCVRGILHSMLKRGACIIVDPPARLPNSVRTQVGRPSPRPDMAHTPHTHHHVNCKKLPRMLQSKELVCGTLGNPNSPSIPPCLGDIWPC
jgi:hypothetical protein